MEVEVDNLGIVPSALSAMLANWPSDKRKPKYLYTIPNGGNPTGAILLNISLLALFMIVRLGATASTDRRCEVLALARKYGFLIIEGYMTRSTCVVAAFS